MKRVFFSGQKCPFRCQYCFAGFSTYQKHGAFTVRPLDGTADIFYPSCDGEAVISPSLLTDVRSAIRATRSKAIVSISTKASIPEASFAILSEINELLTSEDRGFVKISIAFPTKHLIPELEPGTASYPERIRNLKALTTRGIRTSVNCRPILPFVAADEYYEIARDTIEWTRHYLLGPLYVDMQSPFFDRWIKGRYPTVPRCASWAHGSPLWNAVQDDTHIAEVGDRIRRCGGNTFDCDTDLIADLID